MLFDTFAWIHLGNGRNSGSRAADLAAQQVEAIVSAAHDAADDIRENAREAARREASSITAEAGGTAERLRSEGSEEAALSAKCLGADLDTVLGLLEDCLGILCQRLQLAGAIVNDSYG